MFSDYTRFMRTPDFLLTADNDSNCKSDPGMKYAALVMKIRNKIDWTTFCWINASDGATGQLSILLQISNYPSELMLTAWQLNTLRCIRHKQNQQKWHRK